MGPLIIAALLGLACALLVLQPLFGLDRTSSGGADEQTPVALAEVAERERLAKQALLEVDFDHRLGNLGDADYAALKARYERRALAALKARYERERSLDELIERQLDALRKQNPQGKKSGKAKRPTPHDDATNDTPASVTIDSATAASAKPVRTEAPDATGATHTLASAGGAAVKARANSHTTPITTQRDRSPRRRKGV